MRLVDSIVQDREADQAFIHPPVRLAGYCRIVRRSPCRLDERARIANQRLVQIARTRLVRFAGVKRNQNPT
jgi:hypothetical protein